MNTLRRSVRLALASALVVATTACGPRAGGGGGCGGAACASSETPEGDVPPELVGTWTAGRGGTTVAYDQISGTSSSNASGLAFQFMADGTFAKAYRDSTGGGGCSTVVVATESGAVSWGEGSFQLRSNHGVTRTFSSCTPGLVATREMPSADLERGAYTFQLDGDELVIVRDDGASARFRRSR